MYKRQGVDYVKLGGVQPNPTDPKVFWFSFQCRINSLADFIPLRFSLRVFRSLLPLSKGNYVKLNKEYSKEIFELACK